MCGTENREREGEGDWGKRREGKGVTTYLNKVPINIIIGPFEGLCDVLLELF